METILLYIILFLGIVWLLLGIAYLWRFYQDSAIQSEKNNPNRKGNGQGERPKSSVSQEQIDNARHILVGRSKPFISPSVPDVPAVSSSENSADNPSTFATQNVRKEDETEATNTPQSSPEHTDEKEEDNEMQIDYTMDEPDEDSIAREELQIADAAMPEVSPSAILAREVVRITGWQKKDDALDEENEAEVQDMLHSIRGTQLMDYIKEATLKQEKDHQKLLAAIRKAEEAELEESNIDTSPHSETDSNVVNGNSDVSEDDERPLSYYL